MISTETSFGTWVKPRRKALDLTREELARQLGCSASLIFKIEADERRPSRQMAELLARHLEIPQDQRHLSLKIARQEKSMAGLDAIPVLSTTEHQPVAEPRPSSLPLPPTTDRARLATQTLPAGSEPRPARRPSAHGRPSMTETKPRIKITYATLRNDNEELHALSEAGVEASRAGLGRHHRNFIDGRWVDGRAGTFEARSPIDSEIVLGTFAKGDRNDVSDAIAAARRAQPAWRRTWRDRLAILRRAAELISERQMVYGADMAYEVGKNRLEALGEATRTCRVPSAQRISGAGE